MPSRAFFSVLSADLPRSKAWYTSLFGYEVEFDSENSVHITAGAGLNLSPVIIHGEINFADDITAALGLSFGM